MGRPVLAPSIYNYIWFVCFQMRSISMSDLFPLTHSITETQSLMLPSGCSPSLTHSINHWNSLTNVTLRMLLSTHLSVGPVDPLGALVLMWQKFTSQNFNIRVANEARKTFNNSITDKIVAQVNITFCLSNYKQTLWAKPALQLVTLNLLPIRMYVHSMW